jgi:acetyl-CoA carboxylase biotin carboxyl carrier protein
VAKPKREDGFSLDEVRQFAELAKAFGLAELEVSRGETSVRIRREVARPEMPAAPPVPVTAVPAQPLEQAAAGLVAIEAPMVGTFYRAPSPEADPYVKEGDTVKEGQVLCIIEAMKLMNEIESKVHGRIAKILVENGQPVEYGQPLFLVEPRA